MLSIGGQGTKCTKFACSLLEIQYRITHVICKATNADILIFLWKKFIFGKSPYEQL